MLCKLGYFDLAFFADQNPREHKGKLGVTVIRRSFVSRHLKGCLDPAKLVVRFFAGGMTRGEESAQMSTNETSCPPCILLFIVELGANHNFLGN